MINRIDVCKIPYEIQVVEDGILFINKSGLSGYISRLMFSYRYGAWFLEDQGSTDGGVPLAHLCEIYEILTSNFEENL